MNKSRDIPLKTVDTSLYTVARDEVLAKVSIPDYLRNHIDPTIDLKHRDSCLCPFHEENTPSFRYNRAENYWRCFGKCKDGGTVIELHKIKFGFDNHFYALEDLKKKFGKLYGLTFEPFMFDATDTFKSVSDILKEKKIGMSMEDFMNGGLDTIATLIPKIELALDKLKLKDLKLYIEACVEFDSLFSRQSLTDENAKIFYEKLDNVLRGKMNGEKISYSS